MSEKMDGIFTRGAGGCLNYGRFLVSGTEKGRGGRSERRSVTVDARTPSEALSRAFSDGCGEPFTLTVQPHSEPDAALLAYAGDLGVGMPDCPLCAEDVACLIARVTDRDGDDAPSALIRYADRHGLRFSRWTGRRAFLNQLWQSLVLRDRLALYYCAVRAYLGAEEIGDPDADPEALRFASSAESSAETVRSLADAEGEDLLEFASYDGRTGTAAFQAAATAISALRP